MFSDLIIIERQICLDQEQDPQLDQHVVIRNNGDRVMRLFRRYHHGWGALFFWACVFRELWVPLGRRFGLGVGLKDKAV